MLIPEDGQEKIRKYIESLPPPPKKSIMDIIEIIVKVIVLTIPFLIIFILNEVSNMIEKIFKRK